MRHWKICEKWGFNKAEKWYIRKLENVLESEDCKILRPDMTVAAKKNKKCLLTEHVCPCDTRIEWKEEEKCIIIFTGSNRSIGKSNKPL